MSRRHPFFIGNNMENNHEKYMFDALREAQRAAAEDEVPIGAVIVCQGRIIAKGHNMTERLNDPTAHAEMIAITAATEAVGGKYLNDCTLYVTVEPCPMCAGAIVNARLKKVYFFFSLLAVMLAGTAFAQLPANPWVPQAPSPNDGYFGDNTGNTDANGDATNAPMYANGPTEGNILPVDPWARARDRSGIRTWRGSGQHGKLNYIGEATTYTTASGQEMIAPEVNRHNMIVMLDHLEDPHNFGAIIRTCEAAGIKSIIIPKDRSVSVTSTVMKTSAGALEHVNIAMVNNLVNVIDDFKDNGYFVYAADMDGTNYKQVNYSDKVLLLPTSEIKRRLSILGQYDLSINNYMFLLTNFNYINIYDLLIENKIPAYLFISICKTEDPLLTIKKIMISQELNIPYENNGRLVKEIRNVNAFMCSNEDIDEYIDDTVSEYMIGNITRSPIETVLKHPLVIQLDTSHKYGETYIFGKTRISRPKVLSKLQTFLNKKQDINNYLLFCILSESILNDRNIAEIKNATSKKTIH